MNENFIANRPYLAQLAVESRKLLIKLAWSGDDNLKGDAQSVLAELYLSNGVEAHRRKVFFYAKLSAERDNIRGIAILAKCFESGIGCSMDLVEAFVYYELAAKLGHELSIKKIADMYRGGVGCVKSIEEALTWENLSE
jgi:TPR repeat protein